MAEPLSDGPTSHFFVSQRLRLHYADWGNPDAPLLILLHGRLDHGRSWDWTARALLRDWHVVAPDLRGHGDSAWSPDGNYGFPAYLYDLSQLIAQFAPAPVTIVAHSLGGNIALRYAALHPGAVRRLAAIEGLGLAPRRLAERAARPIGERWREWEDKQRAMSARTARRYPSLEQAAARMQSANPRLSPAQARHLTIHGMLRNEDGSYSWKFDNYARLFPPIDLSETQIHALWAAIECPVLLAYGRQSWASKPLEDGRAEHFANARVALFEGAGHWLHHDRLDAFLAELRGFL